MVPITDWDQQVIKFVDLTQRYAKSRNTEKVTMNKSGANMAGMDAFTQDRDVPREVRQVKYLNNIVGQDQQFVERLTRPIINSRF